MTRLAFVHPFQHIKKTTRPFVRVVESLTVEVIAELARIAGGGEFQPKRCSGHRACAEDSTSPQKRAARPSAALLRRLRLRFWCRSILRKLLVGHGGLPTNRRVVGLYWKPRTSPPKSRVYHTAPQRPQNVANPKGSPRAVVGGQLFPQQQHPSRRNPTFAQ